MSARLLPCTGCTRHIRASETECPFCGVALPDALRHAGPAPLPKKRLGRAARFAFGAVVAGAISVTGCSDDDGGTDTGTPDTGTSDTGSGDTGSTDSGSGDTGSADSGSGDTGSADSGSDADTGMPDAVAPPYGAPPDTGA